MTANGTTAGIDFEAVTLKRGAFEARFDLSVARGRLVAVLGPSGSGKSTLLNLAAGFERPDSGRIRLLGLDVTEAPPAERPVSSIFQDNNLFAHLDAFTNVALGRHPGLRLTAADRSEVEAALAHVGLAGFSRRKPGTLSGGERQRVALARVLVRRKPVLLLDEPFAALDPGLRAEMLGLITELRCELALTVLMVTHDPDDATAIADEVAFVSAGRIVATGAAADFFERTDVQGLAPYLGRPGRP